MGSPRTSGRRTFVGTFRLRGEVGGGGGGGRGWWMQWAHGCGPGHSTPHTSACKTMAIISQRNLRIVPSCRIYPCLCLCAKMWLPRSKCADTYILYVTWLDIELRRTLSCALWLGIQPSTSFSQPQHLQLIKMIRNRIPGVIFGQKILLIIYLNCN